MAELDEIAVAARAPRALHHAIEHRIDRRAVGRTDVDALVHFQIAEQRMHAESEGRGDPPRHRHAHEAAAFALPLGVEPARMAVRIVPADEFDLAASLVDAGEQQVAEPLFAGRGAVALDDQVEAIGGPHIAADRQARRQRLDIAFHHARRRTRSARRAVQAGADEALDAQRRAVDRDRLARQHQAGGSPIERQRQIEARAQRQLFERPGDGARRSAAERQRQARARLDVVERYRLRDQLRRTRRIGAADAGTGQDVRQRIALAQRRAQLDMRAFGCLGERRDEVVRRHAMAGVAAPGERRDGLAARLFPGGAVERGGGGADERAHAGVQRPDRRQQAGQRCEAAPPVARADLRAEVGRPVDRAPVDTEQPRRPHRRPRAGHARQAHERARRGAAGQLIALIVAQKHAGGAS